MYSTSIVVKITTPYEYGKLECAGGCCCKDKNDFVEDEEWDSELKAKKPQRGFINFMLG